MTSVAYQSTYYWPDQKEFVVFFFYPLRVSRFLLLLFFARAPKIFVHLHTNIRSNDVFSYFLFQILLAVFPFLLRRIVWKRENIYETLNN